MTVTVCSQRSRGSSGELPDRGLSSEPSGGSPLCPHGAGDPGGEGECQGNSKDIEICEFSLHNCRAIHLHERFSFVRIVLQLTQFCEAKCNNCSLFVGLERHL
jgi:hypothetical protein